MLLYKPVIALNKVYYTKIACKYLKMVCWIIDYSI